MSFLKIIKNNHQSIVNSSHSALLHGMNSTWKRCAQLGNNPQEPDFIAGIVLDSTPLIYQSLKAILLPFNINVSVASVFCHQSPIVNHSLAKTSCELGDLLFVHIHTTNNGTVRRNALLYQAKATSKQPYKVHKNETHQLLLYSHWPEFTYKSPKPLTGKKRKITPNIPHSGAQYLLVDDRPASDPNSGLLGLPGTYPIGSCIADTFLQVHNTLANELFEFFSLRSGKAFDDRNNMSSSDDWSEMIWDLIDIGINKAFNRKNSGRKMHPRQGGGPFKLMDGLSFVSTTIPVNQSIVSKVLNLEEANIFFQSTSELPPDNNMPINDDFEPDGGISLILIETNETEYEE